MRSTNLRVWLRRTRFYDQLFHWSERAAAALARLTA